MIDFTSKLAPVCVDFETEAIDDSANVAPKPVGVAVLEPGKKPRYYAWGHPTKNNATKEQARSALAEIWKGKRSILFHNAKFDLDVAREHFGLQVPTWERIHDTLFLLFLRDPHARSLSLKPSAEALLNLPPEEKNTVNEWLKEQGFIKNVAQKNAGTFICKAPGDIVGAYAIGDVVRTEKLFKLVLPELDDKLRKAYDRERRLLPVLMRNEREGMRVDVDRLRTDLAVYEAALKSTDAWLRKRLETKDLNLDSNEEVADALDRKSLVSEWTLTPTGKRSTSKANMTLDKIKDKKVALALGYRGRISTVIANSMVPWLKMAESNNGTIFTTWNQVRQTHAGGDSGTRTGRLSCSRFQNISKSFADKGDGYAHPGHLKIPELPLVRQYIRPDRGHVFCHRDYNQQEFRILAHFEDDKLCAAYNENPRLDMHTWMGQALSDIVGLSLERRAVKILNFGIVYGMGVGKLALGINADVETARKLKNAQRSAVPGVRQLEQEIKERGRSGEAIRTWGGRRYYCEPPALINGRMQTFEYKLLNYLIQGSAADCTKEAVIRYDEAKKNGRFLVTVHDEINFSAPKGSVKSEMKILRDVMASIEFSVPMLSDGKVGPSWGELKTFKEAE